MAADLKFENLRQRGDFQIVFLVDVFIKERDTLGQNLEEICNVKSRAISLCVLRLLLHFNSLAENAFGNVLYSSLKWGFKFYNSNLLHFEYKRRRFYELDTQSFEEFEKEMKMRFVDASNSQGSSNDSKATGAKSLSCCLTEILHDFPWVTPDMSSPSRCSRNEQFTDSSKRCRNFLFVIGDTPLSDIDLCRFLGTNESLGDGNAALKDIFSTALYEEFRKTCGLSLFWIDSGLWCMLPEKLVATVEDWRGLALLLSVTKLLGGNIIPISSLLQDVRNLCPSNSKATSPRGFKLKSETLAEASVIAATCKFSFGKIVEAFLSGADLIHLDLVRDVKRSFLHGNCLLQGVLYFEGNKVCTIVLTRIFEKMASTSDAREERFSKNQPQKPDKDTDNFENDVEMDVTNSVPKTTATAEVATAEVKRFTSKNDQAEAMNEERCSENSFFMKGVIASADISPSWVHPTKLYSCFSGDALSTIEDRSSSDQGNNAGVFQRVLSLISSRSLSMVIEFQDPDTGMIATGLLQPMTSLCAVLSTVQKDTLLLVEKSLLRHRSRGYIIVPRDATSNEPGDSVLPFDLRKNENEDNRVEEGSSEDGALGESSCETNDKDGNIIDSHIRSFKMKKRKARTELCLKLKAHYLEKKTWENSEKSEVLAPLTRGKLCQDAAQRMKAFTNKESQNLLDNSVKSETRTSISQSESQLTEIVEEDHENMSDIQSVDDLKSYLKESYEKCLNKDQSVIVYVSRVFQMIEHFKQSGELKNNDGIHALLMSTVLCDSKNPRLVSDDGRDDKNKERILQQYKLQVYLHLEFADKIGVDDEEKTADEITAILRAISFQKDPEYLSSFLKNDVIPRYAGNLSGLLRQLYDGLMQRPPKEILSPSQGTSEEDTPLKSREPLSSSKKAKSVDETYFQSSQSCRTLVRRHSVVTVATKRREIAIPGKDKSSKARTKSRSVDKKSGRKSSATKKPVTPVKKVRRNLFTKGFGSSPKKHAKIASSLSERSKSTHGHSLAALANSKKVADTPVAKQVSQRMFRRQEWKRRCSKTVTDVTVIEESPLKDEAVRPFPRKSPRQKVSTFYSRKPSMAAGLEPPTERSTSAECLAEATSSVSEKTRSLYRAKSMLIKSSEDGAFSPRKKYHRSLSTGAASSQAGKEDSFMDVFLENESNDTTILSTCTADTQSGGNIPPEIYAQSSAGPPGTSNDPSMKDTEYPSKSSTILPCTISTYTATRSMNRRSKSSPLLSTTSPSLSHLSPSESRGSLVNSKSFPTTSPNLFKSPRTTPKSSPINFSPEQIFDVAIRLTPVQSPHVQRRKSNPLRPSPLRNSVGSDVSPNLHDAGKRSFTTLGEKLKSNRAASEPDVRDSESVVSDFESVLAASPEVNRKRSLQRARSKACLNFGPCATTRVRKIDPRGTTNDVIENNDDVVTVSNGEIQRSGTESKQGESVACEVFKSPVVTKRRRVARTGNVSPLNQILKQKKNNRSTPPGTPRGETCKHEEGENSKDFYDRESEYEKTLNPKARKRTVLSEEDDGHDEESCSDGGELDGFSFSEDDFIPQKHSLATSSCEQRRTKHVSTPQACNLQPQFTPLSLSAKSLRHLEESPVLLDSSLQATRSCSTRTWSERESPFAASQHSLRKRVRHDS